MTHLKPKFSHCWSFLAALLALAASGAPAAHARDIYSTPVSSANADGSAARPYNLRAATAAAKAGDTIKVLPGNYLQSTPLDVWPGVIVEGSDPTRRPVIKATFATNDEDASHIDDFYPLGQGQFFYRSYRNGFRGPVPDEGVNTDPDAFFYYDPNDPLYWPRDPYLIEYDREINAGIFNVTEANYNQFKNLILDGDRFRNRSATELQADDGAAAGIIMRALPGYRSPTSGQPIQGHSKVLNCAFKNFQGAGVFIFSGTDYQVLDSTFSECGYAENAYVSNQNLDASSGGMTIQLATNYEVGRCQFTSGKNVPFGDAFSTGYGVKAGGRYGRNIRIYDCTFDLNDYQPYIGSSVNFDMEVFGGDDIKVYNNTFRGTFSAVGLNTVNIKNNKWLGMHDYSGFDFAIELGANNATIEDNYFDGTATNSDEGNGVFIKNFNYGLSNLTVRRNVAEGAGAFIEMEGDFRKLKVYNNTVALGKNRTVGGFARDYPIFINLGASGAQVGQSSDWAIKNNIVTSPADVTGGSGAFLEFYSNIGNLKNLQVTNNLLFHTRFTLGSGRVNLVTPVVQDNYQGDPVLLKQGDRSQKTPFWEPKAGRSPAINAGVNVGLPFLGARPEIGAVEVAAGTVGVTPTPFPESPISLKADLLAPRYEARSVKLTWIDRSERETGFFIERATSASGPFTALATLGANVQSYNDAALTGGTTYFYRVRAYQSSWRSDFSNLASRFVPALATGSGSGLTGKYYSGREFNTLIQTRVDRTVNFLWGQGPPTAPNGAPLSSSIGADLFSVAWTGQVQAIEAGTYTFSVVANDGVRLWLNTTDGAPRIDRWFKQSSAKTWTTTYALAAGQRVNLRLDYFENTEDATIQLLWKRPGQSVSQIIPQAQLYPQKGPVVIYERTTYPGGGFISARGDNAANGEGKAQAFDDSVDTKWLDEENASWIQYSFAGSGFAFNRYALTSANDDFGRDPKNWVLKGSNDPNQDWSQAVVLDERYDVDWAPEERKTPKVFSFTNATPYKYLRLEISETEGSPGLVQLAEIEFFSP